MTLDGAGKSLARVLTSDRGEFRIALAPNARRVRALRIGFRPREVSLRSAERMEIALVELPTLLEAVRVTDESSCPVRTDAAAAMGLWQQIQTGLLATIVARDADPARQRRVEFSKWMSGASDSIVRMSVIAESEAVAPTSFSAVRSASQFAEFGYVQDSAGRRRYFSPDADVLIDDAFALSHCFALVNAMATRASSEIGLSFERHGSASARIDIRGTMWVDTVARALREIEFRYAGLDSTHDAYRPGGFVSFRELANGAVMVDQWHIRFPAALPDTQSGRRAARPASRGLFAKENGGELLGANWSNGEWRAKLGGARGRAFYADGRAAAGIELTLDATNLGTVTDADGAFEIGDLIPGPYVAHVRDARLRAIDLTIPTTFAFRAVRDSTYTSRMLVPSAEEFARARCERARRYINGDSTFAIGRVVTPEGKPVERALVRVFARQKNAEWKKAAPDVTTGSDGVFDICELSNYARGEIRIDVLRAGDPEATVAQPLQLNSRLTVARITVPRGF